MVTAEIRIIDDNGDIIGTYNQEPARISFSGPVTNYEFNFVLAILEKERRRSNGENSKTDL